MPQATQVIAAPIEVATADHNIQISPDQLAAALVVLKDPKSPNGMLNIDQSIIQNYIDKLSSQVSVAATPNITDGEEVLQRGSNGTALQSSGAQAVANLLLSKAAGKNVPTKVTLTVNPVAPFTVMKKPYAFHLTFDDAPNAATPQILDTLKQYGVRATFFVIGAAAVDNPNGLSRIVAEGHRLGNHSYSHPHLTSLSLDQARDELQKCQDVVKSITGIQMTTWRPPYLAHNAAIDSVASSLGLKLLWFNDNPNDSTSTPGPAVIASRVINGAKPGGTVILHSEQQTADALPSIITGLRARGYNIK